MFKTVKLRAEQLPIMSLSAAEVNKYCCCFFFSHPLFLHFHSHDDESCRHAYLRSTSQLAQRKKKKLSRVPMWGSAFCAFACLHSCVSHVSQFFFSSTSVLLFGVVLLLMRPSHATPPTHPPYPLPPIPSAPSGYFSIQYLPDHMLQNEM